MALKERLQADLKDALRARDERRKAVIRMALADITNAEVERRAELDDAEVIAVLRRQAARRRETIAELQQANRPDLLANEEAELALLEAYLPQMLSREEIAAEARQVIAELLAANPSSTAGPKLLGQVMRPLMQRLKGRAEGTLVNEVVRELLAA